MSDFLADLTGQYRALFEDYSEWLGSLLRDGEESVKAGGLAGKSTSLPRNVRGAVRNVPSARRQLKKKPGGKSRENESSWIQTGDVLLCSTEQGEAEVLFEAIEEISRKVNSLERMKGTLQQLERVGLGKNVNYIVYIKDDVPEKIVVRNKLGSEAAENFNFVGDFTVQGLQQ